MKNRIWKTMTALALTAGLISGCTNSTTSMPQNETAGGTQDASASDIDREKVGTPKEEKMQVVCTIFPEYDWVKSIVGDLENNYEVTMLLDNGTDLHSYQPTAEDIAKIAGCDLFIFVGGESDEWVEDALKEAINPDMQVINLLETLGEDVKQEEIVEGMQHNHEEEHVHEEETAHEEEHEHAHEEETAHEEEHEHAEYDEHVWLSLKNTEIFVEKIADALAEIDASNEMIYQQNCEAYVAELKELDAEYQSVVEQGSKDTLLFGDRFPFRYLTDDYNLEYYAAFAGCSAETEASFETIAFLAEKVDELGLNSVMVIENSDTRIAETIISTTKTQNQQIVVMNSMQSTTSKDVEDGASYLNIMKENLESIKIALQ